MDAVTAHELREDIHLLDVREQREWDAGHAVEAHHLPMGELAARQDELPRNRPIVAICKSGVRSAAVVAALSRAGYQAENLDGGMLAWRAERLPMEAETDADPIVAR